MGNYIKKASIHPIDPVDQEPVTIGSLSLKEQIEKMELDTVEIKPEVPSIQKNNIKRFTFEETYTSLYQMPHTPTNSPVPSCSSDSDSESPIISIPLEPSEASEQESLEQEPSEQVPLPNPTINDIISSRFWKVKEDFEETHKLIYDMMKELIL
jgi:hypothetical protein